MSNAQKLAELQRQIAEEKERQAWILGVQQLQAEVDVLRKKREIKTQIFSNDIEVLKIQASIRQMEQEKASLIKRDEEIQQQVNEVKEDKGRLFVEIQIEAVNMEKKHLQKKLERAEELKRIQGETEVLKDLLMMKMNIRKIENEKEKEKLRREIADYQAKMKIQKEIKKLEEEGKNIEQEKSHLEKIQYLENKIKNLQSRILRADERQLNRLKANWSSPFSLIMTAFEIKYKLIPNLLDFVNMRRNQSLDLDNCLLESSKTEKTWTIRPEPFDKGTFRYAYYLRAETKRFIAKHLIDVYHDEEDELFAIKQTVLMHEICKFIIEKFNERKPRGVRSFKMISCSVIDWQTQDQDIRRYWCKEPFLEGGHIGFTRFSNNKDYKNADYPESQAMTHFSFELFGRNLMMVDLQGIVKDGKIILTDPAFHTVDESLGESDFGPKGFSFFFSNHVCDQTCVALGLKKWK